MHELTITIRFTRASLGNVKSKDKARPGFLLPRTPDGRSVIFMPTWHMVNMRFAARTLGRHQDAVEKIHWHWEVRGTPARGWFRRYYRHPTQKPRYSQHEAFEPGQEVEIDCVVPPSIPADDLHRLMTLAGRYRGLSPWGPTEFGLFEVVRITPRTSQPDPEPEYNPAAVGEVQEQGPAG